MIAYVARGDSKYKVGESAPLLALRYEKSAKFAEVEKVRKYIYNLQIFNSWNLYFWSSVRSILIQYDIWQKVL